MSLAWEAFDICISYVKTHTITQKLAALVWWQGMAFTDGGMGSAGAATPNMHQSAPEARWDQVCEGRRQAVKQQPSDSEMFPCTFSKHSTGFFCCCCFGHIQLSAYYLFYFFRCSNAPFFLPAVLSRSNICGLEYICLATAAPNFSSAKNKCFASGVGRLRERKEKGAHSGLGALVVEWIWQTLRDDTGLDSPRLASLATIHLCPFVYTSLSFVHPKTAWLLVWKQGLTVMEDFLHQTVQTMHQCSKKL